MPRMRTLPNSEELTEAWRALHQEHWTNAGSYERRVASTSVHLAYAVLVRPSANVGFALELPAAFGANIGEDTAQGLVLQKHWRPETGKIRFTLMLSDSRYLDVFVVLASDILEKILQA